MLLTKHKLFAIILCMTEIHLPDGNHPWTPDTLPPEIVGADLDDPESRAMIRESHHDPYTFLLLQTHAELIGQEAQDQLDSNTHSRLIEGVNQEIRRRRQGNG